MADQELYTSLRISPRFAVYRSDDRLLFTSEDRVLVYSDPQTVRTAETIIAGAAEAADSPEPAVRRLIEDGLVSRMPPDANPSAAYWDYLSRTAEGFAVSCLCLVPAFERLLAGGLAANGLSVCSGASLLVVAVDDYLRPELAEVARRPEPWLLARPLGHTIWLGPLFAAGRTPCYFCLQAALRNHRWQQASVLGAGGYLPQAANAFLPGTLAMAAGMMATAAAVYLAEGSHPSLEGAVIALDTRSMTLSRHIVRGRNACPRCAPPAAAAPPDLYSLVSSITGIVSKLQVTATPHAGFYHTSATFVAPLPTGPATSLVQPQQSIGKAVLKAEAEAAAIAEAAERYSALYREGDAPERSRTAQDGDIALAELLLFSDSQYDTRTEWNALHDELQWVPERLAPDRQIRWTTARSLIGGATAQAPAGYCYMYYPFEGEPRFCSPDTNGCAAGRTLEEAALNALLEVIERDSVAIWWYNRIARPALDLDSLEDPGLIGIRAAFRHAKREPYLLDVSNDLAIPAYVAVAPDVRGRSLVFGCAAHPVPRVAAFKALAEAAQVWFWSSQGGDSGELKTWLERESLDRQPWMAPTGSVAPPAAEAGAAERPLADCCNRVRRAGLEPYVIDLTRRETGVPVARVLVPGMRHFWARFAPGRLYEVPVRMGWLSRPLREHELNPIPCMI